MEFRINVVVLCFVSILVALFALGLFPTERGSATASDTQFASEAAGAFSPSAGGEASVKEMIEDAKEIITSSGEKQDAYSFRAGLSLLIRLVFAAILGAVVALHPTRLLRGELTKKKLDTLKAQILICIAGAMLVILIEGAVERAFGLLGLGSFIRFRTSVKDPRETAIMFLLIGLGMAAGLEMYWVGVFGALFLFVILFPLEWSLGRSETLLKIIVDTPNPNAAPQVLRPIFEANRLKVVKTKVNVSKNRAIFQVMKRQELDSAALQETIAGTANLDVEAVTFDEMAGEDIGADE
ncbi:MgtC/SapB family protein [Thermodesulfobacteriota bacterium]